MSVDMRSAREHLEKAAAEVNPRNVEALVAIANGYTALAAVTVQQRLAVAIDNVAAALETER